MNIISSRMGKKEMAYLLGGSFVSPSGAVNYRKLETYLCRVLNISATEYRESNYFTDGQIEVLRDRKIIKE